MVQLIICHCRANEVKIGTRNQLLHRTYLAEQTRVLILLRVEKRLFDSAFIAGAIVLRCNSADKFLEKSAKKLKVSRTEFAGKYHNKYSTKL